MGGNFTFQFSLDTSGYDEQWTFTTAGDRVALVVRALAFHQCDPGSISALGVICRLSLLVLYSVMRGFPRVLRFSPLIKNQHLT